MLRSPAPEILQDPLVPQPRESNAFARPIGQTLTSGSGTEPEGALEANTLIVSRAARKIPSLESPERPQARSRGASTPDAPLKIPGEPHGTRPAKNSRLRPAPAIGYPYPTIL